MNEQTPDNGKRNRTKDTIKYKIKDNWWWVGLLIGPIFYALISDHFTQKAMASDLTGLHDKVNAQIVKQDKRQMEINALLKDQARVNGANKALLDTITLQGQIIQRHLWDLKNGKK